MNEIADTDLLTLALYVMTTGIIIEAIYQKMKLLWNRTRPKSRPRSLTEATQRHAMYGPRQEEPVEAEQEPIDPKDEIIPVVLGVLVVIIFYPHSIFAYLPFYPQWPWLDVVLTAIIVSRGANLAHETYRDFGSMVSGFIGRISRWGGFY